MAQPYASESHLKANVSGVTHRPAIKALDPHYVLTLNKPLSTALPNVIQAGCRHGKQI